MIKLTRLNNNTIAINPDHIGWADATPYTTLFMISGEKIIVRESVKELIDLVIQFRRAIRQGSETFDPPGMPVGDPPRVSSRPHAITEVPPRGSLYPLSNRGGR